MDVNVDIVDKAGRANNSPTLSNGNNSGSSIKTTSTNF